MELRKFDKLIDHLEIYAQKAPKVYKAKVILLAFLGYASVVSQYN